MKFNVNKSMKAILIIGDELYEGSDHCFCTYDYCKKHLDEVLKKYSGMEENNMDFQSDYFTNRLWGKLHITPLFLHIFDRYLCITNFEELDKVNLDVARTYAKKIIFDLWP